MVSNADISKKPEVQASIKEFVKDYASISQSYPKSRIWNTDQTGFNYDLSGDRTLSDKGERDTLIRVEQRNRATHSYTTQPMISRDGQVADLFARSIWFFWSKNRTESPTT